MAYINPCTGFEIPLTMLAGAGITVVSGSSALSTGVVHQNSSGSGGAQSYLVNASSNISIAIPAATPTTHIHLACRVTSLSAAVPINIRISSSAQASLTINTAGTISIWRGSVASLLATSVVAVVPNEWFLLEVEITCSNTGQIRVWLNRSVSPIVDTGAGIDTQAHATLSGFDEIRIAPPSGVSMYIDDLIIADDTTGRATDEWFGVLVRPTGNGATTDLAPTGSVNNWENVDEVGTPNGTDYNEATVAGELDRYTFGALPYTPLDVLFVQPIAWASRDGTITQIRTTILSDATTGDGSYVTPAGAGTYTIISDIFPLDPDGNVAWTAAQVNAIQAGPQFN